eukprot:gene15500-18411_t
MRSSLLLVVIIAFLAIGTDAKKHHKSDGDVIPAKFDKTINAADFNLYNFGSFIGGIFRGLEYQANPLNASNCMAESEVLADHFVKAFGLISTGFVNVSAETVDAGIHELGLGFGTIEDLLVTCGSTTLTIKIGKIVKIFNDGGFIAFASREAVNILSHKDEVGRNFRGITASWQTGDYLSSGENLGKFLGMLLNI